MSALDTQVGGDHYKSMPIQPMEYSMANNLDACQHTVIKYVTRFREKGGVQDLQKAKHVIDMLIEFETSDENTEQAQPASEPAMSKDESLRELHKALDGIVADLDKNIRPKKADSGVKPDKKERPDVDDMLAYLQGLFPGANITVRDLLE